MFKQMNHMRYSFLATILITFILIIAFPPQVARAEDDYPHKDESYGTYRTIDVDPWKFYYRECTSFVAWRLNNNNKVPFHNIVNKDIWWEDAKNWGKTARVLGYTVDKTPAVGAVAWWDTGTYGHVAWVSEVNGDKVTIEEYNKYLDGKYNSRTIDKSNPTGYIHIKDIAPLGPTSANIENGTYSIVANKDGKDYALDISGGSKINGGNVQIWEWDKEHINQQFVLERQSDNTYKITAAVSSKVVDVSGSSKENSANIHQWDWVDGTNQKWYIVDVGDGYYKFISQNSNMCLDIEGAVFKNGTNIQQHEDNGTIAQKFKLITKGEELQTAIIVNCKVYYAGKNIEMTGGSAFTIKAGGLVYIEGSGTSSKGVFRYYVRTEAWEYGWVTAKYLKINTTK